eukprot:190204-Chlamydomonas_euryale.AAC.1
MCTLPNGLARNRLQNMLQPRRSLQHERGATWRCRGADQNILGQPRPHNDRRRMAEATSDKGARLP